MSDNNQPTLPPEQSSTEALRRRKQRNWLLFAVLIAFVALVYGITIIKMVKP